MNGVKLLYGFNSKLNVYGTRLINCSQFGSSSFQSITRVYSQNVRQSAYKTRNFRGGALAAKSKVGSSTAISIGQGAVAGASIFGVGALAYYGLGFSNEAGIIENAELWPEYVRDRVKNTYLYFGGSILTSIVTATTAYRTPAIMRLIGANSLVVTGVMIAAVVGSGIFTQVQEYSPGMNVKHLAWALHNALLGCSLAPICVLGGPIVKTALVYTGALFGAFSTIAVCAPNDKFLYLGGPLAFGLGLMFISSIGTMFLGPMSKVGSINNIFWLYGGLILFSGFLLYDTQRIIKKAETHPLYGIKPYDPINESISIYLDTLNLFIRIVTILAGNNSKR